jgi:methionyl-tRNA synthetase
MPRYLVTSALPYINGVKHLGNLAGSMLPADVYARFLRLKGEEVLFICGTDEHGTPAELAAADAGLEPAQYCERQHHIQAELSAKFGLSFDHFGRSSSPQNAELTQHFAQALNRHGFIEERITQQIYSREDKRFLPDRYVIGTCPRCGYERARGDQCENCTTLLDPTDLLSPRSALSGSTDLEVRESKNLFLLQSKLAPEIARWIESKENWPVLVTSIARKWLKEGVADRSITRDLSWGIPVPEPGYEDKVFYVWFDAPIEYIAATKEWADLDPKARDWRSWWWGAKDVHYVQFMAKDNVPFHTIGFPSTILGSREPWHLVDFIKGFNWLNYYGGKFSTSQGVGVFMSDALELLPADYWRYFLVAHSPEADDSVFTWETFQSSINKGLADTLGNFVNRTVQFTLRLYGNVVPGGGRTGPAERRLVDNLDELTVSYERNLGELRFRKAAQDLRDVWRLGNNYLEQRAPWEHKGDEDLVGMTLRCALNLVRIFAILGSPVVPTAAAHVLDSLHVDAVSRAWPAPGIAKLEALGVGHRFDPPDLLFRKITRDDISEWKERFGGGD